MNYSRPWMFGGLVLMATGALLLWQEGREPSARADPPKPSAGDLYRWKDLFDGKTLNGWKPTEFGGEGKVEVKDGRIVMEMGGMMTGITWAGSVLHNNYELQLEGMRLDGSDFFCTTTFPVGKDPCTLVVGGWGGMVVGLSNVDHEDASENGTTKTMSFKKQAVVPRAAPRDRCRRRSLDRRSEDGRPTAERPPVRHPHRVRTEPATGHFHLGHRGRSAQYPHPHPPAGRSPRRRGATETVGRRQLREVERIGQEIANAVSGPFYRQPDTALFF